MSQLQSLRAGISGRALEVAPASTRPRRQRQLAARARRRGQEEEEEEESEGPFGGLGGLFKKAGTQKTQKGTERGTRRIRKESRQAPEPPQGAGTTRLRRGGFQLPFGGGGRGGPGPRDPNTVFVAGGSGRLGARIVREIVLSNPKIKVRVGVRNLERAEDLLATARALGILPEEAAKRLSLAACDFEEPESIAAAIGSANTVVQAIGAPESEALNFGNYKKIDGDGAIAFVEAASELGVDHYVMCSSLGTGKLGFPASALNLFGGVLTQKRRAEVALEESGMRFTIVRPGGMERPTDTYKLTHNVRLETRDKLFGGQVSRQQVAELVSAAISNPDLAENKYVEVVAEEDAPQVEYEALWEAAPAEFTQAERLAEQREEEARQAALQEAQDQADELLAEVQAAAEAAEEAADEAAEAKAEAAAARRAAEPLIKSVQQRQAQLGRAEQEAAQAAKAEEAAKAVLQAQQAAAREGRLLEQQEIQQVRQSVLAPEQAKPAEAPRKKGPPQPVKQAASAAKGAAKGASASVGGADGAEEAVEEAAGAVKGAAKKGAAAVQKKGAPAVKKAAPAVEEAGEQAGKAVEEVTEAASEAGVPAFSNPFAGFKLPWVQGQDMEGQEASVAKSGYEASVKPEPARASSSSSNGASKPPAAKPKDPKAKAKANAAEAREWIGAWREKQ